MGSDNAIREAQGRRLRIARISAGYKSAREAALENDWNEGTYRAHERGSRTIGQDDAERYAKRYSAAGVDVTGQRILYGDSDARPLGALRGDTGEVMARPSAPAPSAADAVQVTNWPDGVQKRPGIELWEMRSRSVENLAIVPGDLLEVDLHAVWRPGDLVLAMVGDKNEQVAVVRLYTPPVLMKANNEPSPTGPLRTTNPGVIVRGQVRAVHRPMR